MLLSEINRGPVGATVNPSNNLLGHSFFSRYLGPCCLMCTGGGTPAGGGLKCMCRSDPDPRPCAGGRGHIAVGCPRNTQSPCHDKTALAAPDDWQRLNGICLELTQMTCILSRT